VYLYEIWGRNIYKGSAKKAGFRKETAENRRKRFRKRLQQCFDWNVYDKEKMLKYP